MDTAKPDGLVPSEEHWSFERCAGFYLAAVMPPMPEDRFWDLTEHIGWRARPSIAGAGARLAKMLRLVDCVAAANQARRQGALLRDFLEAWERDSGKQLSLADDAYMHLVHHLVGLGQGEVHRIRLDPTLALRRAQRGSFRASFLSVFQAAEQAYPRAAWQEALHAAGAPVPWRDPAGSEDGALVEHPEHGLGLVRALPGPGPLRVVFEAGDLVIQRPKAD